MTDMSGRFVSGLIGLIVGFLIGGGLFRLQGVPHFGGWAFVLIPLLFGTFWILLIAGAIRWLFMGRDKRLADLPADFDDWHRRAHAQMDREGLRVQASGIRADPGVRPEA